ncbi:glutamate--tRNA ligase family protein [Lentisphaera profundi]|uniref:Glutamate--tRNA ligase family protein n=1 Tax=Lentisphaera profundi TaxID=1658616 RepID=A0ABY7VZ85_9BACT|nr:glutamate--tRNA ligase family protein [Lentisphaera profundi]WDE99109.1 glutamate--tRNA ligase family protein [Lentisphaera profundi]
MKVRGRLAPTPSGELHLGHAASFLRVEQSIREKNGTLVLRIEDVDRLRCKQEFVDSSLEALKALGISWEEGPDLGGDFGPYIQSQKTDRYKEIILELKERGLIYPCPISRRQLREHGFSMAHGEPLFPVDLRDSCVEEPEDMWSINWRFRVPDGLEVKFYDQELNKIIAYTAGEDFGDFIVWRRGNMATYELSVVVDDYDMQITEVLRGEDLLLSTARQILLYRCFDWPEPAFGHCPVLKDGEGEKLAKTRGSRSLKSIFAEGRDWREMLKDCGLGKVLD